jgi:hypothetical protein
MKDTVLADETWTVRKRDTTPPRPGCIKVD